MDENGRKISKRVENTVGKGEIARYEQFLLFPQCFQKTHKKKVFSGKGYKNMPLENMETKGKMAICQINEF